MIDGRGFYHAWWKLLRALVHEGDVIQPRGIPCRELLAMRFHVEDGYENVLVSALRKPSYRFMVAEWLFIWFGHHDVKTIAQYNKNIAQFSDNGIDFNGAYGPPVVRQWQYIIDTLTRDPMSRQAVLTIYQQPKGLTKDVPCTISVQFLVREGVVHVIVNMRSSDIWLGLPYDFFNFSMLGNILAAQLGFTLGTITFHLGSSHLYESNLEAAQTVLAGHNYGAIVSGLRSPQLVSPPPESLHQVLKDGAMASPFWEEELWGRYAQALVGPTSLDSLKALEALHELASKP